MNGPAGAALEHARPDARMMGTAMRRALLACLPAVLACSSTPAPVTPGSTASGPPSAAASPSLVGTYTASHTARMVCDEEGGWCDEKVGDNLEIRAAPAGALAISVELVQDNAHTCTFEGTLAPSASTAAGTRTWRYQRVLADGDDAEADACTLDLAADATSITLTSEGCREYCGVRAQLDARFPRAAR